VAEKAKKPRQLKKETVREKTEKQTADTAAKKPRRIKRAASTAAKPLKTVRRIGAKEYYLPMPDNKVGRFMNKRRRVIPKYFREAWAELRQVTWPTRRETIKLTIAVFIFATIFAVVIGLVDYGLDKVFKRLLL